MSLSKLLLRPRVLMAAAIMLAVVPSADMTPATCFAQGICEGHCSKTVECTNGCRCAYPEGQTEVGYCTR